MASLANTLVQGAQQQAQNSGGQLVQGLQTGANLALAHQKMQAEKAKIENAQAQNEVKKSSMWGQDLLNFYNKVPGGAKKQHIENYMAKRHQVLFDVPMSATLKSILVDKDIDTQQIVNDLLGSRQAMQDSILKGGPVSDEAKEAMARLATASGDSAEWAEGFIMKSSGQALQVKAQQLTREVQISRQAQQQEQFEVTQKRMKLEKFQQRKEKLNKFIEANQITKMSASLTKLNDLIPGGIEKWDGSDIPGVGGATEKLTSGLLKGEAAKIRQLALGLGNQMMKAASGGAIPTEEVPRLLAEVGIALAPGEGGGFTALFTPPKSDQDFVNGLRNIRSQLDITKTNTRKAFGDDAWDAVIGERLDTKAAGPKAKAAGIPGFQKLNSKSKLRALSKEARQQLTKATKKTFTELLRLVEE